MLTILGVGAAQAYEWKVGGTELGTKETISSSGGSFEFTVPKISLTIKCTSESGTGEILTGGTSSSSMSFTGCSVSGSEKTCTVKSPGQASGTLLATIKTAFLEKEIGEKSLKSYDEVKPTMTINITGELCAFPSELVMSGTTAAQVPNLQEESTERSQKFSNPIVEESGVAGLSLGKNPATLTGEDKEKLTGAHKGESQVIVGLRISPNPVTFPGGATTTKMVTITSLSNVATKIEKVKVLNGQFTETNNCDGTALPAMNSTCIVTVTCNASPSAGTLRVFWEIPNRLPAFTTDATLSC
jgi:hypothetical protein